jgi:hypothetical protein
MNINEKEPNEFCWFVVSVAMAAVVVVGLVIYGG